MSSGHIFLIYEKDCKLMASPQIYLPKVLLDLRGGIFLFEPTFKNWEIIHTGQIHQLIRYFFKIWQHQAHQAHLWQQWISCPLELAP